MSEKQNQEIHHVHDKGYKELYSNKEVFLDLLKNMLKLDWAKDVKPEDLILTNKSFVSSDYSETESDLVYRLQFDGQEAFVYVLMEMQSTVDYRMPIRLLLYIAELLREYYNNASFSKSDSKVHLPAVFPIVLYNGDQPWKAKLSLREITDRQELYDDSLLNFRYTLLDVNRSYDEKTLFSNDCVSSIIMLLDQDITIPELAKRLGEIVERFKSLTDGKNRQILSHWLKMSTNPLFSDDFVEILNADTKEVPSMISNLSTIYERSVKRDIEASFQKGHQEGHQEGRQEERRKNVRAFANLGISVENISKALQISQEEVRKLLKQV